MQFTMVGQPHKACGEIHFDGRGPRAYVHNSVDFFTIRAPGIAPLAAVLGFGPTMGK
jgi:hypothetical protein